MNRLRPDAIGAMAMALPAACLLGVFFVWPFCSGLWLSLHQWDGFSPPVWTGLANYARLAGDSVFLGALRDNAVFLVAVVVLKNGLGLALALLLDRRMRFRAFFRAAVFVPVTLSFVAVGLLWSWIYNPVFGLLNAGLDLVGLGALKSSWLGDADLALCAVIAVDVWKWLGFHAVLYLGSLQSIPRELHEAAIVDGADSAARFWHVTLPLLVPAIIVNTVLAFSGAFTRNFDIVYVLTKGGPDHATEIVLTDMMTEAFQNGDLSYATAMGYVLFAIVAVASALFLGGMTRREVVA